MVCRELVSSMITAKFACACIVLLHVRLIDGNLTSEGKR
jgi:hypothetical protein